MNEELIKKIKASMTPPHISAQSVPKISVEAAAEAVSALVKQKKAAVFEKKVA
jgi:hypothetical protein